MRAFFTAKREPGWVAVLLNGTRLDVAHARREGKGRPEIRSLDSFQVEQDAGSALQRLRLAKKLPKARCTTLLSSNQYHLAQFESPAVPAEERTEALRWRFKDVVDFPVESASVSVLDIPMESGGNRQAMVFAVAAGRTAVEPVMRMFDAAKVFLDAIDIPDLAQRNVAALFEEENRGLAFLHLDGNGGLLTITYRGELYAVRRMDISATQLAGADDERRAQLLERVMLELQRTLDNFDRQYSFVSVSGLVVATCPAVPALQPYLAENLYVPVRPMDLSAVCDFPSIPELRDTERQAQCLGVIGAALRTPEAV